VVALGGANALPHALLPVLDDSSGLDPAQLRLHFVHAAPSFGVVDLIDLSTPESPSSLWSDADYQGDHAVDRLPGTYAWGVDLDNDNTADLTYDVYLGSVDPSSLLDVFLTSDAEDPAGLSLAILYPDANGTVVVVDANESETCRFFVDQQNGNDAAHGRSWLNAKQSLGAALDALSPIFNPGLGPCEVWVTGGTYLPATTNRAGTFTIWNDASVYGGFAGGESSLAERDIAANPTILSGDIGVAADPSDNSYHVVTSYPDTRLDGLQIRNGNSQGLATEDERHGAGLLALGRTTVAQVIVADNRTGDGLDAEIGSSAGGLGGCGAGIYAGSGLIYIEDSQILNNTTGNGGAGSSQGGRGGNGAGVCVEIAFEVTIINSEIRGNQTGMGGDGGTIGGYGGNGAGVYIQSGTGPTVIRGSVIADNVTGEGSGQGGTLVGSRGHAGGMRYSPLGTTGSLRISDTVITGNVARLAAGLDIGGSGAAEPIVLMNLIVAGNHATGSGGGIRVSLNGTTAFTLANSLVVDNSAVVNSGGIFYSPQNETAQSGQPTSIVNTIIWGNTAPEHPQMRATKGSLPQPIMDLNHLFMEGGCLDPASAQVSCTEVYDTDPLLVDAANDDFHLQSLSPAIDAGDQSLLPADLFDLDDDQLSSEEAWPFDYEGADRVSGVEVDLGPYEVTP
jgi:hypothetical protein